MTTTYLNNLYKVRKRRIRRKEPVPPLSDRWRKPILLTNPRIPPLTNASG